MARIFGNNIKVHLIFFICVGIVLLNPSHQRNLWESSVFEISAKNFENQNSGDYLEIQVVNLNGTLHRNFFSRLKNITELRIIRNQLEEIESGALCSIPKLKILELDLSGNKNPPNLKKEMFNDCDLEELFLKFDYNNPSEINQDALENIQNLQTLGIDSLRIEHLKKDFLKIKHNSLKKLILSNIHCSQIDRDVFDNFINLEVLEITHVPELLHLPEGLFKNTPKLKKIILKDDAIKDLSWDEFKGLDSLEELDVSDNQISSFDSAKIAKNMPKLKTFAVDINPVSCEYINNTVRQLENKVGRKITIPPLYFIEGC